VARRPTGIEHGTVTAIIDHHLVEVTTPRQGGETYVADGLFSTEALGSAARITSASP
jgi:hypothetical protein